ncbi:FAD-dependent oxidoreductase [Microbacterium sp. LRZ72]|uniref:FAD-dependent oxidoreductase n=1 Tax=Microbacterium sp. LRZ72 TaxID=2942481 RepID=UPI0029BB6EE6|nr:FAD-dependent oxidoreductase [Microbacterium sp. LRZ72]MDX2376002.1 FAD-dependent oxidoreductase [Microbacterium sp. LRZ72]
MESLWRTGRDRVDGSALPSGVHHDVAIVGAGITGLATGLMLVREGRDVAIVESGEVAELATGGNTGKVTLLQGSVLQSLRRHHPASLVRAYVEANRAGAAWLREFADDAGVPYTVRTALSYAHTPRGLATVDAEVAAAREAGLPAHRLGVEAGHDVPFPVMGAAALDGQFAIDPVRVADALARAFIAAGGSLYTRTHVHAVRTIPHPCLETDAGRLHARRIVLATGAPIVDRGLTFAKVRGSRSSCVAFELDEAVPPTMMLSVDAPGRSLRPVTADDGPAEAVRLVVGGNGHPVGRADSEAALVDDLVAWTRRHYPSARPTHRWSAQDYESHNLVPFVGTMPRTLGCVRFATGYAKWGLSNGPAAALRLAAEIRGTAFLERPRWMVRIATRLTVPSDIGRGLREGANVGVEAAKGWLRAEETPVPVPRPAEGEGVVANRAGRPVAISTVDGRTRAVSAVCSHLGGVVEWNDEECTWDCPLHASRFAPDGTRIEGPASTGLSRVAHPHDDASSAEPSGVRPTSGASRGR